MLSHQPNDAWLDGVRYRSGNSQNPGRAIATPRVGKQSTYSRRSAAVVFIVDRPGQGVFKRVGFICFADSEELSFVVLPREQFSGAEV